MMDNVSKLSEAQNQTEEEQEERKTQAQIIVGLASDMKFFYDEQGKHYARMVVSEHREVWPIRSKNFRNILTIRYLNQSKDKDKVPGGQAMEDALKALEARAYVYGKQEKAYVRVSEANGSIYVDLCNDDWQVVEVNKKRWQIVDHSPVNFIRTPNMLPLPTPKPGRVEDLKPFINYKDESDYKLIIAWLLSTFKQERPFPILTLQGEQGSAKSTTSKALRSLVDPSGLPLRALPNDERDLAIAANSTYIMAFDNLSGFSNPMSDALCKMATGGGLATRKLYSDDEEAVFQIMRPAILNGIDDIAKRPDLLDRSLVIDLPSISEEQRTDEGTFWKQFDEKKAGILGGLLDIVREAIGQLPHTKLKSKPRMADFALWVTASEKALGWYEGEFMDIYNANRDQAIEQGIESDPFASAVVEIMKRKTEWIGNAQRLLYDAEEFTDGRTIRSNAWPTTRSVRNRLKRINPSLKSVGIECEPWHSRKHRTLKLQRGLKTSSISSTSSRMPTHQRSEGDDKGDDNSQGDDVTSLGDDNKKTSSPYKDRHVNNGDGSDDNDDNSGDILI